MTPLVCRRLCHRIGHEANDDAGFSLLEVVVSFVLFAIVAAGATTGIVSGLNASHTSQQRVDAANVAQSFIAAAAANTKTIQPETAKSFSAGVQNEQFAVQRWITFSASGASQCSPGSTFTVSVVVNQAQAGKFLARSDSVIAC